MLWYVRTYVICLRGPVPAPLFDRSMHTHTHTLHQAHFMLIMADIKRPLFSV